MSLRTIDSLGDLSGKRVLVRCDLNVPLKDGQITDDGRIRASLPTLNALINAGARVEGFTYSQFIHGLDVAGIVIDRKVLSDIAGQDPVAFKAIADKVRTALAA